VDVSAEPQPAYSYAAVVVRVVDGDTVVFDVDLGFGLWMRSTKQHPMSFRLAGCNARELGKPGGKDARDNLMRLLPVGTWVLIRSVVADKYGGRYDVRVHVPGIGDLTEYLILTGWAVPWDGNGIQPVPAWPIPLADPTPVVLGSRSDYGLAKGERPPE
jgi:endonuclease YncB( thermonuclease family)